jgi:hypothetical protein
MAFRKGSGFMRVMLVALAFGMAAPAMADDAAPQEPVKVVPAKKPKIRMVCEEEEAIGTRLGSHKVCHAVGSDAQFRQETRDSVDGVQRNLGLQH